MADLSRRALEDVDLFEQLSRESAHPCVLEEAEEEEKVAHSLGSAVSPRLARLSIDVSRQLEAKRGALCTKQTAIEKKKKKGKEEKENQEV